MYNYGIEQNKGEKDMIQKYLDDLLEIGTVKEGNEYVLGYYHNRVPVYGLYLKAKKDSILERVEIMAKGKFKLELDAENYAQEVRAYFFMKLKEYIEKNGEPTTEKEIDNMNALLYKMCRDHMVDIGRSMKNNSLTCDKESGEFSVVRLLSLDSEDDFSQMLQGEVEDVLNTNSKESFSYFRIWFNENKESILTKKQLAYLEDEQSIMETNRARMNKTISERIYRNYTDESIIKHRVGRIEHRKEILKDIMEWSKTDRQLVYKIVNSMKTESWLLEAMYSLSFDTCKMFTDACKDREYECKVECVEEIRGELQRLYDYLLRVLEGLEKKL